MGESQLTKLLFQNLQGDRIRKLLGLSHSRNVRFHREVGNSAYIADICISINSDSNSNKDFDNHEVSFIAIEVKISDWENGLYQAWRYNNFAEKSFLAIYKPHAAKIRLEEFEENNIGLIVFDEDQVDVRYQPKKNIFRDNTYQAQAREKIWNDLSNTQSVCPAC